jgi:endogenous inhibitor of DNA gyrase (YacG/DUF329 family)
MKESTIAKCPGCDKLVKWTGIFGPWCHICYPRY